MSDKNELAKCQLLEQAVSHAQDELDFSQSKRFVPFLKHYYADVAPEDLIARNAFDLFGAALTHWQLAGQRTPDQARIRVYNPDFDEHGWQSSHSIVEIVNQDMPFLVDSVGMALNRFGITKHLIIHPVLPLSRNTDGQLEGLCDRSASSCHLESFIHVEIDRQTDPATLERIGTELDKVLQEVRAAVEDWPRIIERVALARTEIEQAGESCAEIAEFMQWLQNSHFTFLGYRQYDLVKQGRHDTLKVVAGSGLGILREQEGQEQSKSFAALPAEVRKLAHDSERLILTKANSRANIHRPSYLDYVGVKRVDSQGKVIGEHRFLGLYTANVYNGSPNDIPVVRRKLGQVLARAGYLPGSHKEKTLQNILETYPRDELFEIPVETLINISRGIVNLQERQRARLFVREDVYRRYLSCLVYVPRDNYNTEVRLKMQAILQQAFGGTSTEYYVTLSESILARIEFIVRIPTGHKPEYDLDALEAQIAQACRRWRDDLAQALLEHFGEEHGTRLLRSYGDAFPVSYREDYQARSAVHDLEKIERLREDGAIAMHLYHDKARADRVHFKLLRLNAPISLSQSLPMLENMGVQVLDEHPYCLHSNDGRSIWISDFALQLSADDLFETDISRENFQQAFAHIFRGEVENDGLNRLVVLAGLNWREVTLLRAYSRYLRQAGLTFNQTYIEQCLAHYAGIAHQLVELFHLRLSPEESQRNPRQAERLEAEIRQELDKVENLDDDRILNSFLTVILCTLRSNFFQPDKHGQNKPYLSFKLNSRDIGFLPLPRPMVEIWVYSPRMEGIHLRGGKVARGGLRWSDRMEDFRTEVLGLVKAQMVKNAVIVPVGSKGGFVCKQLPPASDRDAFQAEGVECYKTFIRGLLDLTDNLLGNEVAPPQNVVRLDDDDPYLVVAADKGTASFSDIANAISQEYGFWLDDAFASGGSAGYDHKKMAITARGAWESVKRHFRELGIDTQTQEFSVVGIGDMSGDVFGNGMLRSQHIRLLAAFDHRHIFIDPDPDTAASFAERERLFRLPRSSWADYNPALISGGGGIYPRSAKSIKPSAQACAVLGIEPGSYSPAELIHEILKAPVDLLYNGGIGTYIKASRQNHSEANDRANDILRVNANELRCKVIAEGGNLGLTQPARVEYALCGGRINTDAIDNSGGVDCSDHEVNIKILLNGALSAGDLTLKQRNKLLADMTDEVAELVLRDNYQQTQAISLAEMLAAPMLNVHARFIQFHEKAGKLNRRLEYLPSEEEIADRRLARQGLTRPELAVLLAYAKITMYESLLDSHVPGALEFTLMLAEYFPKPICKRFADQMYEHYLKYEIIATHVTNTIVNRMGITFAFRLGEETGATAAEVAFAWAIACEVFRARHFWQQLEALDNQVPAQIQMQMQTEFRKLIERATRWMLRNSRALADHGEVAKKFAAGIEQLLPILPHILHGSERSNSQRRADEYREAGVPEGLAQHIALCEPLVSVLDIIEISHTSRLDLVQVAGAYFDLGTKLQLDWLLHSINSLPRDNRWQTLARSALRDDLYRQHRALAALVLQTAHAISPEESVDMWLEHRANSINSCMQIFSELQAQSSQDLAMLSAALREVRNHLLGGNG
ncbi:MAG: glutamate dehydrogenase [Pseudomonadota bacterium]|nr:glutamate dehydrogenase [Pseudomonadota bacterium]